MVPVGYAEKSMASLMQLHTELMDEKERRVELYRRLMDKEQTLAELKMYVRLLEERVSQLTPAEQTQAPSRRPKPSPPPRPTARERLRTHVKSGAAANGAGHPFGRTEQARGASTAADAERSSADGWRAW